MLVAHMTVHPMLHGFTTSTATPSATSVSVPAAGNIDTAASIDNCDLCRVSQSVTNTPEPAKIELLNPHWIPVRIRAVTYASLQVAPRLPSRAPPSL
jgi:hypothetical protein